MMDAVQLENLTERVNDLERQNRLLKRVGALLVMGSAVLVVVGTGLVKAPRQLEAQRFVVRDQAGRVRARLGLRHDGQPTLTLLDERGQEQLALRTLPDQTSTLDFFNRGEPRVSLMAGSDGSAALNFFARKNAAGGLAFWIDSKGAATLARGGRRLDLDSRPTRRAAGRRVGPLSTIAPTASQVQIGRPGPQPSLHLALPILGTRTGSTRAALAP